MTFTYPAVFIPHENDGGYHVIFPDLACCEGDGPDLEDAIEDAKDAEYAWIESELLEDDPKLPQVSHTQDIDLPAGAFIKELRVTIKLLPDSD